MIPKLGLAPSFWPKKHNMNDAEVGASFQLLAKEI